MKKIFIPLFIAFLCFTAFWSRIETFQRTREHTLDEVIYYHLGLQLKKDLGDYNTLQIKDWIVEDGRKLQPYFTQPIFKYPPLFFYFLAGSIHLFGEEPVAAAGVSVLFGVLAIPLVYLLGTLLFGQATGVLAAFFFSIDPISVISSQKVWLDSTLTFFTLLAVYLFVCALKSRQDRFFVLSGIASGLAVLVKYPGILAMAAIAIYILIYRRDLLKNKNVWLSFFIPFVMLIPWAYWNYEVYGWQSLAEFARSHNLERNYAGRIYFLNLVFVSALLMIGLRVLGAGTAAVPKQYFQKILILGKTILAGIFFWCFCREILLSLQWDILPAASRFQGLFKGSPRTFYLGKLLEYSFLYFLALGSFFMNFRSKGAVADLPVIKWAVLVILVFYSMWGSFQSRYILAAIPFLIILAAAVLTEIYDRTWFHPNPSLRWGGKIFLILSLIVILARSYAINSVLSANNNFCYF